MKEAAENKPRRIYRNQFDLDSAQMRFYFYGSLLVPFLPFLYLQGKFARLKVGRLPDALGETLGKFSGNSKELNLIAIGESTVAGIGAGNHREALTGQFSKHLNSLTGKTVNWQAFGISGTTIRRTIKEILPQTPEKNVDIILLSLGANDVFRLSTPKKFRKDMIELLAILQKKYPEAKILIGNIPMIRDFIALPNPLRFLLSRLAKSHHFNMIDLAWSLSNVFYFKDVGRVEDDFFSDGIHPSVKGYDLWSKAMVESFLKETNL